MRQELHVCLPDPLGTSLALTAPGSGVRTGRLTAAVLADLGLPVDANAYVCGPGSFMDATTAALGSIGLAPDRIHTERFAARGPSTRASSRPTCRRPPGRRGRRARVRR